MNNMKDLGLQATILNSELTNITKDTLELGLDSILEDGLLKDIPVLGTIISFSKIGLNIKDRLFIKKLIYFLYNTKDIPVKERQKMISKINKTNKYKTSVGEKLIYILDKSDEIEKAQLIGSFFNCLLRNEVNYDMFIRGSEAINNSFLPDLRWFFENSFDNNFNDRIETVGLLNSGILKIAAASGATMLGGSRFDIEYNLSEVGECLFRYLRSQNPKIETLRDL